MIEYTLIQKWRWVGHIARMEDNRWTKRCWFETQLWTVFTVTSYFEQFSRGNNKDIADDKNADLKPNYGLNSLYLVISNNVSRGNNKNIADGKNADLKPNYGLGSL